MSQSPTPEQETRWAKDKKLEHKALKIILLTVLATALVMAVASGLTMLLHTPEKEPQQVPIGMKLEDLKSRIAAYSYFRDNKIALTSENFGYYDDRYGAGYTLGGTALVEVYLTDKENQIVNDIFIVTTANTDDETTMSAEVLCAFNQALTGDTHADEMQELLIDAVAHDSRSALTEIEGITIKITVFAEGDGYSTNAIAYCFERFE